MVTVRGKTTVYRVEDAWGDGPYSDCDTYEHVLQGSCSTGDHYCGQIPDEELYVALKWKFGFRSLEDTHQWFHRYIYGLAARGYVLAEYEVLSDDVVDGDREVMFDPEAAEAIETKPLEVLA